MKTLGPSDKAAKILTFLPLGLFGLSALWKGKFVKIESSACIYIVEKASLDKHPLEVSHFVCL